MSDHPDGALIDMRNLVSVVLREAGAIVVGEGYLPTAHSGVILFRLPDNLVYRLRIDALDMFDLMDAAQQLAESPYSTYTPEELAELRRQLGGNDE